MSSLQHQSAGDHAWFVAAIGIATLAGYGWGKMQDEAPAADEEREVRTGTKVTERLPEGSEAVPKTARELAQAVIDGSLDDREHWRHVSSFTEDEVKEAIGGLEKLHRRYMQTEELPEMLFYRWGELNPVAANEAAKAMYPEKFPGCRRAVIAAWINQGGGVAAWNAVQEEGGMWDCTQSVPGEVSEMLVASLSDRDDVAAFKEVLQLDDENCEVAELLCRARADRASRSPESRAAFLAAVDLHPKAYVRYSCARDELVKAWAEQEPEAAEAASLSWEKEREAAQREEDALEEAEWLDKGKATGGDR